MFVSSLKALILGAVLALSVAAPRASAKDVYKPFLDPMPMDGFQSATLNRTFEKIVFGTLGPSSAAGAAREPEPMVVAGPLCESGDVFTRDDQELLQPRLLGRPDPGDLVVLHDAGAYGAVMSSNYVSMGRAAQVLWENGQARLIARRETLDDILRTETDEALE